MYEGEGGGYIIDKRAYGTIRLRWQMFGTNAVDKLAEAQAHLGEYATVIMAGKDPHSPQMHIHAKPSQNLYGLGDKESKKGLRVQALMIREDVWQAILELPVFGPTGLVPVQVYRDNVRVLYESCLKYLEDRAELVKHLPELKENLESFGFLLTNPKGAQHVVDWLTRDATPFTVGWGTHWKLLVQKRLPIAKVQPVLDSIGEMIHVTHWLYDTRWYWQPSNSVGSQLGDPAAHYRLNEALLKIALRDVDALDD